MQQQLDGIVQRNLSHAQVRQHFLTRELTHLSLKERLRSLTIENASLTTKSSPITLDDKTNDGYTVSMPTVDEYLEQADSYLQQGLESAAIGSFVRATVALVGDSTNNNAPSSTQTDKLHHALLSLYTLNAHIAQIVVNRIENLKPIAQELFPTANAKI